MAKKYIDADKLIHDLEERIFAYSEGYAEGDDRRKDAIETLLKDVKYQCSLQQEQPEQPTRGYDESYLNDCIAKAKKSWEGVDVDKFMDEVRGREPEVDLEKALNSLDDAYFDLGGIAVKGATYYLTVEDLKDIARHFYELGKNSK